MQRNQSTARKDSLRNRQIPCHCDPIQMCKGKHQNGAEEFERRVLAVCEYYKALQFALIRKESPPLRSIKHLERGKIIAVYDDRTEPGFTGTLCDGITVAFETVFTSTDRVEKKQLSLRQEEILDTYEKLKADVFVLVGFSDGRCFRIPWSIWRNMQVIYERKYLKPSDLISYEVQNSYLDGKLCIEVLGKAYLSK